MSDERERCVGVEGCRGGGVGGVYEEAWGGGVIWGWVGRYSIV